MFSAAALAQELVETFLNGNRKYVIEALDDLPQDQALAVCAYVVQYLHDPDDHYNRDVFCRMLSDRV